MSKRNILAVALITSFSLTGCSTLQKLNPFASSKPLKAPCKVTAIGDLQVVCEGKTINLDMPEPAELEMLQLRGRYHFKNGSSIAGLAT